MTKICKNCGKKKEEHFGTDQRWCYDNVGSCGSQDWQEFAKEVQDE